MDIQLRGGRAARATRAVVALAGAVALTWGVSAAAGAAPPPGGYPPGVHILNGNGKDSKHTPCPAGWVCVYDGVDYKFGALAVLPGTEVSDVEQIKLPDGGTFTGDDGISAWVNNSPVRYCWYDKKGFVGTSHEMAPSGKDRQVSPSDGLKSFRPC
ncbi:peptidase inhibitor family I36 protein [Streptomyces sp. NBC_00249]|uniref:peptidase inhibitor family I36 protein n=1 Tax=Streptomyces sp. NBC_00249 TaxID=2975690 RepID=UPI00224F0563|nr:peptidase inhibitor family I36 protein [Streptomyces sp. NBC_00249]MCX5197360.1 peptidase inhibitor family I36 protein [Streptomyces sp. NBC_00249]